MITTVDLDEAVLGLAMHRALREGRTLSSVVSDALAAYLGAPNASEATPLRLVRRDGTHAHRPSPGEFTANETDDELTSLQIPAAKRRPSP